MKKNFVSGVFRNHLRFNAVHEIRQHRLLYVEVPKAACTSIKLAFRHFREFDDLPSGGGGGGGGEYSELHDSFGYKNIPYFCFERTLKIYRRRGWKIFTAVRNPYDRFVSHYKNFLAPHGLLFDEYIEQFSLADHRFDNHLRPQHELVGSNLSLYDHIGRVEHMHELYSYLETVVGPIEHVKANTTRSSDCSLTGSQRHKVYEIYKGDFELLGYAP